SNIMIAEHRYEGRSRVVLIDFGLAREVTPRMDFTQGGKFCYAAPEQLEGRGREGFYSDVYGLAATAYHMLTGEVPLPSVLRREGHPLKPLRECNGGVSKTFERAVWKAMRVDPRR